MKSDIDIQPILEEITEKLQFLEDSILLRTARMQNMCESLQLIVYLMGIAAVDDPTQFTRAQFNLSTIIAKATTNGYLIVNHCVVTPIKFRTQTINDMCYKWIPIYFQIRNSSWDEGFLNPKDKVIHKDSARIECFKGPTTLISMNDLIYSYQP